MVTSVDFSGKKVAIFGLGDQEGYPDTFVDAIGVLANIVREGGDAVVGQVSTDGYEFDDRNTPEPTKRRGRMDAPEWKCRRRHFRVWRLLQLRVWVLRSDARNLRLNVEEGVQRIRAKVRFSLLAHHLQCCFR